MYFNEEGLIDMFYLIVSTVTELFSEPMKKSKIKWRNVLHIKDSVYNLILFNSLRYQLKIITILKNLNQSMYLVYFLNDIRLKLYLDTDPHFSKFLDMQLDTQKYI